MLKDFVAINRVMKLLSNTMIYNYELFLIPVFNLLSCMTPSTRISISVLPILIVSWTRFNPLSFLSLSFLYPKQLKKGGLVTENWLYLESNEKNEKEIRGCPADAEKYPGDIAASLFLGAGLLGDDGVGLLVAPAPGLHGRTGSAPLPGAGFLPRLFVSNQRSPLEPP